MDKHFEFLSTGKNQGENTIGKDLGDFILYFVENFWKPTKVIKYIIMFTTWHIVKKIKRGNIRIDVLQYTQYCMAHNNRPGYGGYANEK